MARRRDDAANSRDSKTPPGGQSDNYEHQSPAVQRPAVGVQEEFPDRRRPKTYRYDSSLAPELAWDESAERELAEWLLGLIEGATAAITEAAAQGKAAEAEAAYFDQAPTWAGTEERFRSVAECVARLKSLTRPFLNWAGKAERQAIRVPTIPLFVHERHSTQAILSTLESWKATGTNLDLFGDPELDPADHLDAYEHLGPWSNRLVLGDSLQVMNSLLEYEGLGGQVQMIYMDPPYGVKFGSNFQPFVRKRDVKHGQDADMIREPEMVKAYRDTWELGLHSYLTYLRDRLLLARELLTESGSIFLQISDENLHHVREVMDEVFLEANFVSVISFRKTTTASGSLLSSVNDFIVWYAKDRSRIKHTSVYFEKSLEPDAVYKYAEMPDGSEHTLSRRQQQGQEEIPKGARIFALDNITSPRPAGAGDLRSYVFRGIEYKVSKGTFKTDEKGMANLDKAGRLGISGSTLRYKRFIADFPVKPASNVWDDTSTGSFTEEKAYVVQTSTKVIQRCMLMTTDPGDLVLDPTCGSGTTAYVAEQWGRRWITCDTSRVPLALARQRLLTATFPWYELKEPARGPAGGFVYQRRHNRKGEEVGGLVPRITLKSIANGEEPETVTLVDRPEVNPKITRVCGRFTLEATVQAARSVEEPAEPGADGQAAAAGGVADIAGSFENPRLYLDRMIEVLRQSRTLRLPENESLALDKVRALPAGDFEHLHAEAVLQSGEGKRLAICFGPEHSAIDSTLVMEAHREAYSHGFDALCLFGFAIEGKARELIGSKDGGKRKLKLRCIYVNVTPDVVMSDLLKTSKSSEVFSVTGLPDVRVISFEFLVLSGALGERYVHWPTFSQLSGLDRVAEVDGLGAEDIHLYALLCQGRAVWHFLADEAGWRFTGGEHRGGSGTQQPRGIHSIPWDRTGLPRGVGDFDHDLRALGLHSLADCRAAIERLRRDPEAARSLAAITKNEKLTTKNFDLRSIYQVRLLGLDVFRPHDLETEAIAADNLPCWMLDTDYNGMVFMARQVFFPKTSAWENLERSLRGRFAEGVWEHLAGTESEPFPAGAKRQVAIKVIDERGNELMVVKGL